MLRFKDVDIAVSSRSLLKIDDLTIEGGLVALVGRNGSGKSTLLKSIVGQHKNFKGTIALNNQPVNSYSALELAKTVAIVYTKPYLFGRHTVREVIVLGRLPYQNFRAKITANDRAIVDEVIEMLALKRFENQSFNSLSDGEKQLVMIGRALAQQTPILLLDEPSAFLDIVNKQKLMTFIRRIADETNKLILFSTHQIDILEKYCDTVLLINQQNVRAVSEKAAFVKAISVAFNYNDTKNEV